MIMLQAVMLMMQATDPTPPPSLLTGLGGYWKLDGSSTDSLGVSNGADTNVSYVTGKIGQAASPSAGTWNIALGTNLAIRPLAAITVAGWFKWAGFQANARAATDWHQSVVADRWILGYEAAGGGDGAAVVTNSGETSTIALPLGTGLAGNTLATGTWYHLGFSYDGAIVRAYRDGAQVGSAALSGTMNGGSGVRLGQQLEAGLPLNGMIDEVGIWQRALTAPEFAALYNAGTGLSYPF
jgi:hypothetical protein